MKFRWLERIDDVCAGDWNRLAGVDYPFMRHEFLAALEHADCVGQAYGWLPRHAVVEDPQGRLLGAVPLYLKFNSYGEFVFDWSWADAYERAGGRYYPKLVVAAPYTPASGPRLLTAVDAPPTTRATLIEGVQTLARDLQVSSVHWLFPDRRDQAELEQAGLMRRMGVQYHWHNADYDSFEHFLAQLTSAKRKKIKRERRRVKEAELRLETVHGHEATAEQLAAAEYFYRSTFDKKWGTATLNLAFFSEVARTMGDQLVLMFAYHDQKPVAGAICFRSSKTLYGRHWGCVADYHSLHFELCYYRGIDYCIEHDLEVFEPGAQGEHKVSRGFIPVPTYSAHWIADSRLRGAIEDFLVREQRGMKHYLEEMQDHLPFRRQDAAAPD